MSDAFFKFKCDIDGRFAEVRLYRGRIEWQAARVSSTVRILAVGVPAAVILGAVIGFVAAFAFRETVHGGWDIALGVAVALLASLVFGYRLGVLLGDVILPTKGRPVQSILAAPGMRVVSRAGGRIFSFIDVTSGAGSIELRIGPKYAELLVDKLRAAARS